MAFVAVCMTSTIGITLGALAGYYGGVVDAVVVKISEIIQTMPMLLIVMTAARAMHCATRPTHTRRRYSIR